jgi:hypothetical protein
VWQRSLSDSTTPNRVQNLALTVTGTSSGQTVFSANPSSTVVTNGPGALYGQTGAVDFCYTTNGGSNGTASLLLNGDARSILNGVSLSGPEPCDLGTQTTTTSPDTHSHSLLRNGTTFARPELLRRRLVAPVQLCHGLHPAVCVRLAGSMMPALNSGVQYASSAYVERLQEHGVQISLAARGNPSENAQAESFFKTLKGEEVYLKEYQDAQEAERHLERFIEDVYNTKRLHSALGYRPPAEFELLLSREQCELALVR